MSLGGALPAFITNTAHAAGADTLYQHTASISVAHGSTQSVTVDASGHQDLKLSFHYNGENMDNGDSFTYGWRVGAGATTTLGTVQGIDEGTTGDETGDVTNLSLPVGADVSNLSLYITNNSNSSSDTIYVSSIVLTGVPTPPPACKYDFPSSKMWEVTWGYDFAHRNGGTAKFNMQSNGGLVSLNGGPVPSYMTASWHWLYLTDHGAGSNQPIHYDYGFADGTVRTVDVSWSDVNGCPAPEQTPEITWGYKTTATKFVGSPKYVRINHGSDLAAQIVSPDSTQAVHFFVDGDTGNPINGTNVGGAGTMTSWWRLYTPLPAGTHTISAEVELGGSWYPVSDTGTTYAIGNPTGHFVAPSASKHYFRPSDNPLRIEASDINNSFADVVFHVDGKDYLVTRNQCDTREAGNRVLCDVNDAVANTSRHTDAWTNLAEGDYTATATIYNQARNHVDVSSLPFTVDGTAPKVLNAAIVSPNQTVYKDSVVVAQYVQEADQLNGVSFYVTQPRHDGQCDPNEAKVLGPINAHFINRNGDKWYYRTTVDTSSLNGKYCIFSVAEDAAMSHSNPQEANFSATFDNTAPVATIDSADPSGETFDGSTNISVHVVDSNYTQTDIYGADNFHQTYHAPGTYFGLFWLKNGNYTMVVSDAAGNSTTYSFTVNRPAPTITFGSPTQFNSQDNVTFQNIGTIEVSAVGHNVAVASTVVHIYNADGSHSSAWCGAAVTGDTASCDASGLADGNYYVKVAATDTDHNSTYLTKHFTVDTTAPAIPSNLSLKDANGNPIADGHATNSYNVTAGWTDNDQSVDHYIYKYWNNIRTSSYDGEANAWTTTTTSTSLPGVFNEGEGTHYFCVEAVDAAGNVSACSAPFSVTYDHTAPALPTIAMTDENSNPITNGYINTKNFTFNLTNPAGDGVDHYQLKYWNNISGSPFNGQSNAWNPTSLNSYSSSLGVYNDQFTQGEGTHYFEFSACDAAGNCSAYSSPFQVVYDATAPIATITAPSDGSILNGTVTVSGTTSPDTDHYYLVVKDSNGHVVAGPGVVPGASISDYSWDTTGVADGTYTIDLEVRDHAGNKDGGSVATAQVTVDNTAPGTVSNLTHSVNGSAVTWNWDAATDATSGVAGYLFDLTDSQGNHVVNFPTTTPDATLTKLVSSLPDDTYTFSVTTVDNAGNRSAAVTDQVVVDTVAPVVVIKDDGQNGNVIQPSVTVDGSSTPVGYSYSWTTHAGVTVSNTSALNPTFTVNQDGTYTFQLTVTDASGNATTAPFTFTYITPSQHNTGGNGGFTAVSTTTNNSGSGTTGTPVTLTNNGTGTTTPQVLGASTKDGNVQGDSTVNVENSSKQQNKDTGNSQFLGLGWWWLPILLVILAAWWILFGPRRKASDN